MSKKEKKVPPTIYNFKLSDFKTNIVIEHEIQDCVNVIALDRDSHAIKSKQIDFRIHFGMGSTPICDYLCFDLVKKKYLMVEKKYLSEMFNNGYAYNHDFITNLVKKIRGTIRAIYHLNDNKFIEADSKGFKLLFIFVIEGKKKDKQIFDQLSKDIINAINIENNDVKCEILYFDAFIKKYGPVFVK